jgi:hypothetical protein
MILYKYCDPKGVDILESLRIKVTPPIEFNDPFELTPQVVGTMSSQEIEATQSDPDFLEYSYQSRIAAGTFRGSKAKFEAYMRERKEEEIQGFLRIGVPALRKGLVAVQLRELSKDIGVLCLSETGLDILMWAHYCAAHTGLVIGLTTEYAPLNAGDKLLRVSYEPERARLDLAWTPESDQYTEYVKKLVLTKSLQWRYEQEWREIFSLRQCGIERQDNRTSYFVTIKPRLITRVILGCRCDDQTVAAVKAALSKPGFRHVVLEKAVLHEREFALEAVSL